MGGIVSAGSSTLLRQAHMTADEYLLQAIDCIDRRLGDGYARAHPELIAAFMNIAARDFHTSLTVKALDHLDDSLTKFAETVAQGISITVIQG